MGGGQVATRHPFEIVRGGLPAGAELAGALASDVAERATEGTQAVPAGLQGNVGNG